MNLFPVNIIISQKIEDIVKNVQEQNQKGEESTMNAIVKVAVIGAGAAGMTAAIAAAENGAEVSLFEKNDRVGKKILATGNGKCNLSNLHFSMQEYYCCDKEKLLHIFQQFSVTDTLHYFEEMGLMLREKNGYVYPYSEQASAVLDVLRTQLQLRKVRVVADSEITSVTYKKSQGSFYIKNSFGKSECFQRIILACGSPASLRRGEGMSGYQLAQQMGHRMKKVVPGLVQLKSEDSFMKALSGVRCQAGITLFVQGEAVATEKGEVQFTDFGVSGIPVFQLSRTAAYAFEQKKEVVLQVNFFTDVEENDYWDRAKRRFHKHQTLTLEEFLTGTANKKINMVMIKRVGLKPNEKVAEIGWRAISELMKLYRHFSISLCQANTFEKAQICAGGVDFSQITSEMESQIVKGLFFAGEMVDVDGKCGGYNLQWAWTSGYLAGKNASKKGKEEC